MLFDTCLVTLITYIENYIRHNYYHINDLSIYRPKLYIRFLAREKDFLSANGSSRNAEQVKFWLIVKMPLLQGRATESFPDIGRPFLNVSHLNSSFDTDKRSDSTRFLAPRLLVFRSSEGGSWPAHNREKGMPTRSIDRPRVRDIKYKNKIW